jgi:hypothetical protein
MLKTFLLTFSGVLGCSPQMMEQGKNIRMAYWDTNEENRNE